MTANRLATAASAYLQSASHQPIHWYPWGAEAFAAARAADRPVLLDIGAVWCHWCHVMDGESYEDPGLAAFLNDHYVCIKVDRDERPDVDARYQRAVQALIQQGGWPLTAFLTPAGEVFYGGTYFPPDGRYGRPGFRSVLESVLAAWRDRREQVTAQAEGIRQLVEQQLDEARPGELTTALLDSAVAYMERAFDPVHGGFGTQPKFPHPSAILLLLHRWHDTRSDALRQMIDRTLEGMARGGIHDQLGGGFHRYSVDAEWIVPHFEKMSYDNSELLRAYADAYGAFGTDEYADVARGIVRWVHEVLADPGGGYGASQDADVGLHDDGDYFTWTREEAAAVLSVDQLAVAAEHFDIGTAGEMHHDPGRNVLFHAAAPAAIARRIGRSEADVRRLLDEARRALVAARDRRIPPFVDRTRYASWNAMLAGAILRAAPALGDQRAGEQALRSLARLRVESPEPDAVPHAPGGSSRLLDDQVQTASAALDAWEYTGDGSWLEWATAMLERVWRDYADPADGALFDHALDSGEGLLPSRAKPVQDAPTPSANGTAAIVAARLGAITGVPAWTARAEAIVRAFAGTAAELGMHAATLLIAADWILSPATHLVVTGPDDNAEAAAMHQQALATWVPRRVVRRLTAGAPPDGLPAPLSALLQSGTVAPTGYLCTGLTCRLPAEGAAAWAATLRTLR